MDRGHREGQFHTNIWRLIWFIWGNSAGSASCIGRPTPRNCQKWRHDSRVSWTGYRTSDRFQWEIIGGRGKDPRFPASRRQKHPEWCQSPAQWSGLWCSGTFRASYAWLPPGSQTVRWGRLHPPGRLSCPPCLGRQRQALVLGTLGPSGQQTWSRALVGWRSRGIEGPGRVELVSLPCSHDTRSDSAPVSPMLLCTPFTWCLPQNHRTSSYVWRQGGDSVGPWVPSDTPCIAGSGTPWSSSWIQVPGWMIQPALPVLPTPSTVRASTPPSPTAALAGELPEVVSRRGHGHRWWWPLGLETLPCQDHTLGVDGFPYFVRKPIGTRCGTGRKSLQLRFHLPRGDGHRLPLGVRSWFAQTVTQPVRRVVNVHLWPGGLVAEEGLEVGGRYVTSAIVLPLQYLPRAPLSVAAERPLHALHLRLAAWWRRFRALWWPPGRRSPCCRSSGAALHLWTVVPPFSRI